MASPFARTRTAPSPSPSPSNLAFGSSPVVSASRAHAASSPSPTKSARLAPCSAHTGCVNATRPSRATSVVEESATIVSRGKAAASKASRADVSASRHVGTPESSRPSRVDAAAEPPGSSSRPRSAPTSARVADGAPLPSSPRVPAPRARLVVSTTTVAISTARTKCGFYSNRGTRFHSVNS